MAALVKDGAQVMTELSVTLLPFSRINACHHPSADLSDSSDLPFPKEDFRMVTSWRKWWLWWGSSAKSKFSLTGLTRQTRQTDKTKRSPVRPKTLQSRDQPVIKNNFQSKGKNLGACIVEPKPEPERRDRGGWGRSEVVRFEVE